MQWESFVASWAVAVLNLCGWRVAPEAVAAWERRVVPLTPGERLHTLIPPPETDLAPNAPDGAAELERWRQRLAAANPELEAGPAAEDAVGRVIYLAVRRTQGFLDESRRLLPPLDTLQAAHALLFDGCPGRGQLRRRADAPGPPQRAAIDADPLRAMEGLARFTRELLARARDAWGRAEAVAFYHADFLRLRPFVEGNHLLALVIAGAQLELLFGRAISRIVDADAYAAALQPARQRVSLVPLTRWFHGLAAEQPAAPKPLPPRVHPGRRRGP